MELSRELVFEFIESENPFPIDFDDAMVWWDCRTKQGEQVRKGDLKEKLEANFDVEKDYQTIFSEISEKSGRGRPREKIFLTIDCFKMFGMMVSGDRGNEIRRYFVDCEAELKRRVIEERNQRLQIVREAYILKKRAPWERQFPGAYFEQVCRLKGWKYDSETNRRPQCLGHVTNELIYKRLQPGVLEELQRQNPTTANGRRKYRNHQFLTKDIGNPHLRLHLRNVTNLLERCSNWKTFMTLMDHLHPIPDKIQVGVLIDLAGESFEDWEKLLAS